MTTRPAHAPGPGGGIDDHATFRCGSYYPALDGLRAIAVLLVFAFHLPGRPLAWVHGWLGVEIFFVLSGFLITTLLSREHQSTGRVDLVGFYTRRTTRILPLYFVVLGVQCVAVLALGLDEGRREAFLDALPYYVGFFQEVPLFQDIDRPFGVSWSLGIEEKFYFVWPLLGFALIAVARVRVAAAAVLAALAFSAGWIDGGVYVRPYFGILVGVLLALAMHERPTFERVAVTARPMVASGLAALVIALVLSVDRFGRWFPVVFAPAVAVLIVGLVIGHGPITRALATRPLRWVGRRSYAAYLVHTLVIAAAERLIAPNGLVRGVALAVITLSATLFIAEVLHRWIEQPCIEWGRRRSRRRTSHAGAPVESGT